MLGQNSQLYVFILVVLLLLVLLWFLLRDPWKEYGARITAGLLASNPELKKINWSDISAPDLNTGVMTTTGFYDLPNNAGRIGIAASGKDKETIQKFIEEVKFYFEPIFEKPPSDPLPQLRGFFSQSDRRADKYQRRISSKMAMPERSTADEQTLEENDDLLVEIAAKRNIPSDRKNSGKLVQAIAFVVDPTLGNNKSTTYSYKGTYAYDTVAVRTGGVNAKLNPGADGADKANVDSGADPVKLYSDTYKKNRKFSLKVKGTGGATNTYRLSGIWNEPYEDEES